MPASMLLDQWAVHVERCFGATPYHVGSSFYGKTWRDVDVRVILEDAEYERWFGSRRGAPIERLNTRWVAICTAFSIWGQQATGLPIDFQVVARSNVTAEEWDKARNPLGIFVTPQPWEQPCDD